MDYQRPTLKSAIIEIMDACNINKMQTRIKAIKTTPLFGKTCPKCDSKDLKTLKPSIFRKADEALGWPFRKKTMPLNVCRNCGFSWEDR